ncbi:MAG: hypothetical protein LR011_13940 [Verrucomicrobia bacterium]|nr:hypothetical protein [Verrucomicrobiota bacterium]
MSASARADLGMPAELTNILIVCLAGPVGKGEETQVITKAVEEKNPTFLYSWRKTKFKKLSDVQATDDSNGSAEANTKEENVDPLPPPPAA